MTPDHIETLRRLGACDGPDGAIHWATPYPDAQSAWDACHRGDWLALYVGAISRATPDGSPEHRRSVLIACLCARTSPRLPEDSERAISMMEEWAWGGEDRRQEARNTAISAITAANGAEDATVISATTSAYAATHNAAACVTAADAVANSSGCIGRAWCMARARHYAALADLIRSALPTPPEVPCSG